MAGCSATPLAANGDQTGAVPGPAHRHRIADLADEPPASRLRKASMTHCPARSRTRRPLYRSSPASGTARPVSNGPSTESPGTHQMAPGPLASRRCRESCPGRQEKISTGRPATTSTCGTSRCQKPVSGWLRAGAAPAIAPDPPTGRARRRPAGPPRPFSTLAVTSMCQPSPLGSANTHGSRHASSRPGPSSSYQLGSHSATGEAGWRCQVSRSAGGGHADALLDALARCSCRRYRT